MRGRSENDPTMIRPWSDHETVSPQPASQPGLLFELTTSIFYGKIQRFAPNLTFKPSPSAAPATKSDTRTSPSTAPATKSDTWTSPNTAPATKSDTRTSPSTAPATKSDAWTSPNTAPATKSDTRTSPRIAPATQKDSHASSSSHMKRHLQCAEQQASPSNITKYCACHTKFHSPRKCLKTVETSFPMRGRSENDPTMIRPWSEHDPTMKPSVRNPPRNWGYFSSSPRAFSMEKYNVSRPILHSNLHQTLRLPRKVTLALHEVLRLPRKVTLELHQVLHLPRKVTLELHQILRLPRKVTLELHQILRLPRKITPMLDPRYIWNLISNARSNRCQYPTSPNTAPATKNDTARFKENLQKQVKRHFQCGDDPSMIRAWSEHDPTMKTQTATRLATGVTFRAHHEHFLLNNTTFRAQSYIQTFTKYCACHEKYNSSTSRSTAPATKSDTWTSPNTAPATQKDSHASSSSHMKPHFQCAEPQVSLSNLTKYCACHEKWHCKIWRKSRKTSETSFPMRGRSEHDPTMIRAWSEHDPTMKTQPASPPRLLFETTSIFYWKIQRFAPNLTFKPSPNTAPATKSNTSTARSTAPATKSDTWTSPSTAPATKSDTSTSPNTAPATKSDTWTSPNTAPATKNDSYAWSSLHMKPHFQCAEQQVSLSNLTKYCACHEKWHCKISRKSPKTSETSFPMRGRSEHDPTMIRAWSEHDPTMKTKTATRLATEVTFRAHHEHFLLNNTTFRAQSYIQTFTKYCACHEK